MAKMRIRGGKNGFDALIEGKDLLVLAAIGAVTIIFGVWLVLTLYEV